MRKRLFGIIEISLPGDKLSQIYDYTMMVVIVVSLIPLAFKHTNDYFLLIDHLSAAVFIFDYVLRLFTADLKLKNGAASFALYPFTPMAIIDLLCILPSFTTLASGLRVLKVLRLLRTFRVFRAFKMFRYSRSLAIIIKVIRAQQAPLMAVCTLSFAYILVSALVVLNVEPDTFDSFFDAIYWATVSLTTMGYGDIYPVTAIGRIVTMFSSFIGIAIVALPAGIITAGYMDELNHDNKSENERKE